MNIIAVDDEVLLLGLAEREIKKAMPDCSLACFDSAAAALSYARQNTVDTAFLDINMGGMNGLELAEALKELDPKISIIFVTGYNQYIDEAFKLHCSGYVMKPFRADSVAIELARLRHNQPPTPKLPDSVGAFSFDHSLRRVYKGDKDLAFTPMEYRILLSLTMNVGEFISVTDLFKEVFGVNEPEDMNTLYVHISSMRKKLELFKDDSTIGIEHKRGKGYKLITRIEPSEP